VKIMAFSDMHGRGFLAASALIDKHQPNWVICCGDMLPDFIPRPANSRLLAQQSFWRDHRHLFIRSETVTTMIVGNHELPGFRYPGMDHLPPQLEGRVLRLEGIPGDSGPFSFANGLPEEELEEELQDQLTLVPNPLIYLSHAPPFGSCDKSHRGDHIGNRPLFRHLHDRNWPRALVLCGHVHGGFGVEEAGATTIVNAATGFTLIEWAEGFAHVMEMNRLVEGSNFWVSP